MCPAVSFQRVEHSICELWISGARGDLTNWSLRLQAVMLVSALADIHCPWPPARATHSASHLQARALMHIFECVVFHVLGHLHGVSLRDATRIGLSSADAHSLSGHDPTSSWCS